MIIHIVLLKLKSNTSKESIGELYKNIIGLENKIPGIVSISRGANISPEGKDKGYTEGFVIEFKDVQSRNNYLPHLEHIRVAEKYILPIVDDVLVFDCEK